MRLKQVFIPLRISKGLLCLIAMFVMLLAPQVAWASRFTTSTDGPTVPTSGGAKYTWAVTGLGTFSVYPRDYDDNSVTLSTDAVGLTFNVNGGEIRGLEGDSSAPSDYEHFLYKVKIAGIDDNSSITVKIINGSDNFYFIASTTAGEFYMPNSVRWDSDSELFIEVKDACTITGVEVFRSTKSLNGSFGWSGDPKDNNNAISGAKQNDGSIKINALEHQSYSYPFANEGVTYSSTNTSVAAVGTDGTVTIKKIGSTTITATVRNYVEDIVNEDITFGYTLTVDFPAPTIIPNGGHQLSATEIALSYEATNMPDLKYKWGDGEEKSFSAPFAVQTGTLTAWAEIVPSEGETAIKSEEATATFTAVAGTSYGLTVAGIPVTSENCDNVLGDNEDVHKVTYDPESKTLTLNNVTMEGNVVRTNSDNLTVNFVGTSRMTMAEADHDYAFVGNGGVLTLTTTGSVVNPLLVDNTWRYTVMDGWDTENSTEVASSNTGSPEWWMNTNTGTSDQIALMKKPVSYNLYVANVEVTSANASDVFEDGKVSYNATTNTLILNNFTFNSGEQEKYGVKYTGTSNFTIKLIGTNSITTGNGCEPIIYDSYPVPETIPTLTFEKGSFPCSLTLNGGNGTVIKYFGSVQGVNGLGSTTTGDLYLLADAEAQYNASTGLTTSSGAVSKATITSGYGLTVAGALVHDGNKDNVLGTPEGSTPTVSFTPAIAAEGDEPAIPDTLTLNGATIAGDIETSLDNLTISVSGANTLTGSIKYIGTNNSTATLTIDANLDDVNTASLELSSKEIGVISGFNTVTVNSPLETTVTDWTSDVKNATLAAERYDISIAGVIVTNANKDNVLGTPEGTDPTVSFTPAVAAVDDKPATPATLTLNNATIVVEAGEDPNEFPCILYSGSTDLTIKLIGNNTLVNEVNVTAIRSYSENSVSLTFAKGDTQPCSLEMSTGDEGDSVIDGFSTVNGVNGFGSTTTGNLYLIADAEAQYIAKTGLYKGETTSSGAVTSATITSGYGLIVGGVLVHEGNAADIFDGDETNDGKVSYTTNKLTLNGAKLSGESISYVGTENLTIELNGNSQVFSINYVNDNADEKPQLLFTKADGVTSCSLTLDSRGDGSVIDGFSAVDFGTFNTMSSVPLRYGKIDPDENYVCLLDAVTNDFASDVTITTATTYPIWVKGNQVTADNADDLFNDGTDDKDPSVSFTPAVDEPAMPATLTLNGVNYSLNDGDTTPLVVSGLDNLTVKLVGSSSVYTSTGAQVYPDAAFVSTNSEAVLTFTTDESTRLQPLNTNSIELASGFKSIAFTGYLYREQNMVKNLLAPTPGMDGKFFTVNRAGYEPDETTFNYVIEYTDNTQSVTGTYDMSKTATENNIVLDKPCTVTVYAQYGTLKSAEKVGKLFGFEGGNELNTVYGTTQVAMPTLVPAIAEADGITIAKEGNFVDNDKTIINLSGKTIGKASTTIIASLTASNDTPYTLLNSSVSLNVNILPPAPTIEFDAEKTYLNSDKVSISLPESLVEDENASIKYSWVADCEPGNGNNYDNESKVELNAGTHTLYAWVRYNGATADDAVYSERVSQEFTAKTDINQFAVKDLLDNTTFTYTGTAIVPTFTLYDAMDESNTLSTDDYDVRIEKFVDQATGYSVVDDIVDAGKYMVYAVGMGTTYGGEKIIYEGLNVEKANLTLTVSDDDLTYNGKDQPLITINNVPTGATVKYYCRQIDEEDYDDESFNILCEPSDDDFSDDVPNGKNVGYFALIYKVDGGKNYKSQDAGATIKIAILPAEITELKLSATELPYNGENQAPSIASVKAGDDLTLTTYDYTISYEKITGDETTTEINASEVKAVGSYNVVVTGQGNFTGTAKAPFAIVDRTLAVGAEGDVQFGSGQNWATYYTETEDLLLPDNIAAYVVTGVDGSTVTTQRISKVMSNVPVLLQQYTTAPAAEINDDVVVSPFWKGTTEATNVSDLLESRVVGGAVYVLYNNAFVKSKSGAIPANRGYLLFGEQAVAPRLTIELPGGTTGVSDVRSKKADVRGDFYDLQGRKVQKPSKKGLYINEGHKVVVK